MEKIILSYVLFILHHFWELGVVIVVSIMVTGNKTKFKISIYIHIYILGKCYSVISIFKHNDTF